MEKLKQEDRNKLSRILYNNWDNVFGYLAGSSKDEDNVLYKEAYKYELEEATKDIISLIDTYLEANAFFNRDSVKNWLIENIIGGLLRDMDCRGNIKFYCCINNLYELIFPIIKPYYIGLYPEKKTFEVEKVIETNISMKDDMVFDHQSRVIEVDSWDNYCTTFKEYDGMAINCFKVLTTLVGNSIPKDVEILNLHYDNHHLTCDFKHKDGWIKKKLAYRCKFRYDV